MITRFLLSKALSPSSLKKYRYALELFCSDFSDQSSVTAEQFSDWLLSKKWGSSCSWVYYSAIKQFLSWAYGVNHPALSFKFRRLESPPQRTLTVDQVKKLFSIFDTSTPKGRRDLSMCSLFLDTGLRVSEISNLEIIHTHLEDDQLFCDVFCKGGKWGRALFSPYTSSCIISWLRDRSDFVSQSFKYLFCSIGGLTPGNKLTREGIQRIVFYWGKSCGFLLSPHDLRRTFATLATIAGAPSRLLQVAGRWSDISMVERYTRSIQSDAFRAYFPVDFIMRD